MADLVSSLVHYGHPGCVDSVMVEGRFLMRDGRVTCMDVRDTLDAAQEATVAAWRRLHETSGDIDLPDSLRRRDESRRRRRLAGERTITSGSPSTPRAS